jgi:hypothetical protein
MKRILKPIGITALAVCAVLGFGLKVAPPAAAQPVEQCDDSGECLNLWNGGPYVNTYGGDVGNSAVSIEYIDGRCDKGDTTTANCPYSGVPAGLLIFQLLNNVEPGNCIGDFNGSSTDARVGGFDACNNPGSGSGGSYGTVFFMGGGSCPPGAGGLVPVQYWSAHWPGGKLAYPGSGTFGSGQNDEPWYENSTTGDCLVQTS